MWMPGETFTDSVNGISITVDTATSTGFTVTIGPSIDLEITSLDLVEGELCAGTIPVFRALIRNNSSQESGAFGIRFIQDGLEFDGVHLSIPAEATDSHDHVWKNSNHEDAPILAGEHTLTVIADAGNGIEEPDEGNNEQTIAFTVDTCDEDIPPTTTIALSPLLNAAGWSYRNVTVSLAAVDNDGGSGIASITYSASGAHPIAQKIVPGDTTSFLIWKQGETTVTFHATDNAGNVESAQILVVKLDKSAPVCDVPTTSFTATSLTNTTASVPVEVRWSCSDATSGIDKYLVQRSTNGGTTWTSFSGYTTARSKLAYLVPGTTYLFRARAIDAAGLASAWKTSAPVTIGLVQETPSASVVYGGTWSSGSYTWALGGQVRYTSTAGRTAQFTFTGREVAWIAPKHKNYGIANVYVDNILVGTVDLYAASLQTRQVLFRQEVTPGTHTLKIEVTGTKNAASTGTFVFVDAFVVVQ
jgi:hypothetical protein